MCLREESSSFPQISGNQLREWVPAVEAKPLWGVGRQRDPDPALSHFETQCPSHLIGKAIGVLPSSRECGSCYRGVQELLSSKGRGTGGKTGNDSVPQLPPLQNGDNNASPIGSLRIATTETRTNSENSSLSYCSLSTTFSTKRLFQDSPQKWNQ